MKKTFKTALVIVFVAISSLANAQYEIVGKWGEKEGKDSSFFLFHNDGYISISVVEDNMQMDGHGFELEGFNAYAKYTIKKVGKRLHFNMYIILVDLDSTVAMVAPGIIEFIDANTIKIAINFENEAEGDLPETKLDAIRPKDFNNPDETVIMVRIKY